MVLVELRCGDLPADPVWGISPAHLIRSREVRSLRPITAKRAMNGVRLECATLRHGCASADRRADRELPPRPIAFADKAARKSHEACRQRTSILQPPLASQPMHSRFSNSSAASRLRLQDATVVRAASYGAARVTFLLSVIALSVETPEDDVPSIDFARRVRAV